MGHGPVNPDEPALVGRCGVYGTAERPAFCEAYPSAGDWRPLSCAYTFAPDGTRGGSCDPNVCGDDNCCNWPRKGGEPNANLQFDGGLPCKHLTGLAGRTASPRYAQLTSSALWVRDSHLARTDDRLWAISRVKDGSGPWTGQILWTLHDVPTQALQDNVRVNGGQLCLRIALGREEAFVFRLSVDETAALWRLHPPMGQAGQTTKALDV